jgi:hypothetical protein
MYARIGRCVVCIDGESMRKKIILWLMSTKLYSFLITHVIPYVRISTYYTPFRGHQYHAGYSHLEPGHIIVTTDAKKLTGFLIPGVMSHAALCVNKRIDGGWMNASLPGACEVVEMTHTNFTHSDFFDICKESSRVIILECLAWDEDYRKRVAFSAMLFTKVNYDIHFNLGVESLYCSELIYQADRIAKMTTVAKDDWVYGRETQLNCDLSDLAGLGRPYISPDGLLFAKNVRVVWDSEGELTGLMGPEVMTKLGCE